MGSKEQPQGSEGCQDGDNVHRNHDGGVPVERNVKVFGDDDVDEIRDHEGKTRRVGDEAGGDDEGQGPLGGDVHAEKQGQDDRREEQGGPVVGEDRRNSGAQKDDEGEELAPRPPSGPGDVDGRPVEEARLVQKKGDDDQRHEGEGRVPDDVPDEGNVPEVDDPRGQGQEGPSRRAPSDAEAPGLPDDEDERDQKD